MQDAEDEPLFCERVAGLDIAKAGVEVTIRVPSETTAGRRQQETRSFGTTRAELESLGDWLACWGVTRAGMEATEVGGRAGPPGGQVGHAAPRANACAGFAHRSHLSGGTLRSGDDQQRQAEFAGGRGGRRGLGSSLRGVSQRMAASMRPRGIRTAPSM